ncbi:hypothetical protein [Rhizorhabdus dicambivorans]|uniref:hypothetical protein n=1 Tax=Rhizorhabdus dicambivorans TaxID=1850238 RepID=UPI00159704DF|nr:hypothetical protein [Rhizorhabdus dicambivorans]
MPAKLVALSFGAPIFGEDVDSLIAIGNYLPTRKRAFVSLVAEKAVPGWMSMGTP